MEQRHRRSQRLEAADTTMLHSAIVLSDIALSMFAVLILQLFSIFIHHIEQLRFFRSNVESWDSISREKEKLLFLWTPSIASDLPQCFLGFDR